MRAVGYDLDEGRYIVLRDAGVTPTYAQEMATLGLGKPGVGTLLQLRQHDVTKQYLEAMTAVGMQPRTFDALVSYRILKMNPDFVVGIKAAGFDAVTPGQLRNLAAVGATPEEAKALKLRLPNATVRDLILSHLDSHPPTYQDAPIPAPPPDRSRSSGTPPSD